MTDTATEQTAAEKLAAFIAAQGLTMAATFVPYSEAKRERADWSDGPGGKPWEGLTWRVTIAKGGREVLTTRYSAGVAHCPSYKQHAPTAWEREKARATVAWEIENGYAGHATDGMGRDPFHVRRKVGAAPIMPVFADVLASLALDASAIDFATFEEWAPDFGYDPDSRKAEAIYRACLEIGLKLRSALGDDGLNALREAAQDY